MPVAAEVLLVPSNSTVSPFDVTSNGVMICGIKQTNKQNILMSIKVWQTEKAGNSFPRTQGRLK